MTEARKLTTIVVTDVVAFSRLTAAQEELTFGYDRFGENLIDPLIAAYCGRDGRADGRRVEH